MSIRRVKRATRKRATGALPSASVPVLNIAITQYFDPDFPSARFITATCTNRPAEAALAWLISYHAAPATATPDMAIQDELPNPLTAAPGDTIRLSAIATTPEGATLLGFGSATHVVTDST